MIHHCTVEWNCRWKTYILSQHPSFVPWNWTELQRRRFIFFPSSEYNKFCRWQGTRFTRIEYVPIIVRDICIVDRKGRGSLGGEKKVCSSYVHVSIVSKNNRSKKKLRNLTLEALHKLRLLLYGFLEKLTHPFQNTWMVFLENIIGITWVIWKHVMCGFERRDAGRLCRTAATVELALERRSWAENRSRLRPHCI